MKKRLIILTLAIMMLLTLLPGAALAKSPKTNSAQNVSWSDVGGAWYTDAVLKYGYADIFDSGNGKFEPNKKITRIEFVRLLHKALGITINYFAAPNIKDDFTDMKNTDVGANELIDLVTAGIVDKGGAFNPTKQLDREVMVHWIINALNYKTGGDYAMIMIMPAPFEDDNKITEEYKNDIVKAQILKLIVGRGNNMLHPKQGATRAEAVTAVMRLSDLLASFSQNDNKPAVDVTAMATEDNGALIMNLTISNNSDKRVTITHTSGQEYDFQLLDSLGNTVYTWSADKSFIMALSSTGIAPGQSVVYTETLDKDAWSAIKEKAFSLNAYIVGTSNDFPINPDGYSGAITLK